MENKDYQMMSACVSTDVKALFAKFSCEHPMDIEIQQAIEELMRKIENRPDDFELFHHREKTDTLWGLLIEKSIKCLRYYDKREPFLCQQDLSEKSPKAYGVDGLKEYYHRYAEFEQLLYGSSQHYRDHVIHVLRTWLSGVELLTKNPKNSPLINYITINERGYSPELNIVEKLSIWTLVSLTHDLGYPLQTAMQIIDKTRAMVSTFISSPDISVDFSFHGVQNYMNDFIVRLMSSKMVFTKPTAGDSGFRNRGDSCVDNEMCIENRSMGKDMLSVARLQPKYYFKFLKSLEQNSHGILSTLIIYKMLTYFLESDYSINEDYQFDEEECRQFYIRREILRAIASHTCDDVYQLYLASFSFLLRICDDTQEWGRKSITELYVKADTAAVLNDIDFSIDTSGAKNCTHKCTITEEVAISGDIGILANLMERFRRQSLTYIAVLRDGQDTNKRDFDFIRKLKIKYESKDKIELILSISKDKASSLTGSIIYSSSGDENEALAKSFFETIPYLDRRDWTEDSGFGVRLFDDKGQCIFDSQTKSKLPDSKTWRRGEFSMNISI